MDTSAMFVRKPMFLVRDCGCPAPTGQAFVEEMKTLSASLTEEEKKSPFARYYYMGCQEPDYESRKASEPFSEADPALAFMPTEYGKNMNKPGPGPLDMGYCILPNGVGFASALVRQEGITDEMVINYSKHFAAEAGDMFYKVWFPGAHVRHYSDLAIEDPGCGMVSVRFVNPIPLDQLGVVGAPDENDPDCIALFGFNVEKRPASQPDAEPLNMILCTYIRETDYGREVRLIAFMGVHVIDGKDVVTLPGGKPIESLLVRGSTQHFAWEYGNAARNCRLFWEDCHNGTFHFDD